MMAAQNGYCTILTWMAERKSDVFLVATANDISAIYSGKATETEVEQALLILGVNEDTAIVCADA
ncbi:hypothetical protein KT99_20426 [Shewanella benthica KT99]|uniref:Uncharacterized protein n=2 Tax=Shewanella benthica TaxID=43661 RepID=A9D6P2_9GAMM|nr:hypothetical protein KT99_20426 [Shewanella benthica KT99]